MPEPVIPVAPTPPANQPPANAPTGDNPTNQPGGNAPTDVDFSKLSDEQLAKALEDPRLWKTPRLQELRDAQKALKDQKAAAAQQEEEALKKKGEFETLAKKHEDSAKTWQGKYESAVIDNAIMNEAAKLGVTDLEAAKLLVNRAEIKLDENGAPLGIAEAVKALVDQRAYLKTGTPSTTPVGTGTNPPNPNQGHDFTMSQIADPVFYNKNRDAIALALQKGTVKEDRF